MKVGKEDAMGMLAAVEMWVQRDHDGEWDAWMSWLDEIAASVRRIEGVTTEVLQPAGLSNHSPRLEIRWDGDQLGVYGSEVEKDLWGHDPRIVLANGSGTRREGGLSKVTVMPWQMSPGDATVVAQVLHQKLSDPPQRAAMTTSGRVAEVEGAWDVEIRFLGSAARHAFYIEQSNDTLRGSHRGDRTGGDLTGWVEGDHVHLSSRHRWEGSVFGFSFNGTVNGDRIEGAVDMGEYFTAGFVASRHLYGSPSRPSRPQKNV